MWGMAGRENKNEREKREKMPGQTGRKPREFKSVFLTFFTRKQCVYTMTETLVEAVFPKRY
jgi:hypothetical protein